MSNFFGFICQSCNSLQPENDTAPVETRILYASICTHCGQVISALTKQCQRDDYLTVHTVSDPVAQAEEERQELLRIKNRKF